MRLIRNIAKVFFPAFSIGIGFCFVQMLISDRPIMSAGLMCLCVGMTLMCANVEVWAEGKLKERKDENGEQRQHKSHRKTA
jgi:hypothetical protein